MSENISAAISVNGEIVMKQPLIKSMRVVKKETLKLISDWVSRTNDHQMVSFLLEYNIEYLHKYFFQKYRNLFLCFTFYNTKYIQNIY